MLSDQSEHDVEAANRHRESSTGPLVPESFVNSQ